MVDGCYYTAPVTTLPPRLPGFSDLLGMTFQLWPGSPSVSEAASRQWSFWDLTKCLVNYKVTRPEAGHKETFKPPDVFLLASNKADVLDFSRMCVIYLALQLRNYIFTMSLDILSLLFQGKSFFQVHINQITFETLQGTDASSYRFRIKMWEGKRFF